MKRPSRPARPAGIDRAAVLPGRHAADRRRVTNAAGWRDARALCATGRAARAHGSVWTSVSAIERARWSAPTRPTGRCLIVVELRRSTGEHRDPQGRRPVRRLETGLKWACASGEPWASRCALTRTLSRQLVRPPRVPYQRRAPLGGSAPSLHSSRHFPYSLGLKKYKHIFLGFLCITNLATATSAKLTALTLWISSSSCCTNALLPLCPTTPYHAVSWCTPSTRTRKAPFTSKVCNAAPRRRVAASG